jgi:hypothetical protein
VILKDHTPRLQHHSQLLVSRHFLSRQAKLNLQLLQTTSYSSPKAILADSNSGTKCTILELVLVLPAALHLGDILNQISPLQLLHLLENMLRHTCPHLTHSSKIIATTLTGDLYNISLMAIQLLQHLSQWNTNIRIILAETISLPIIMIMVYHIWARHMNIRLRLRTPALTHPGQFLVVHLLPLVFTARNIQQIMSRNPWPNSSTSTEAVL